MANKDVCNVSEIIQHVAIEHQTREFETIESATSNTMTIRNSDNIADVPSLVSISTAAESGSEIAGGHSFSEESRFDPECILGASYHFSLDHMSSSAVEMLSNRGAAPYGASMDGTQTSPTFLTDFFPGSNQVPDKIMWTTPQMFSMPGSIHNFLMEHNHETISSSQGETDPLSPKMISPPLVIGNAAASSFVQRVLKNVAGFKLPNSDILQHSAADSIYSSPTPSYVLLGKQTVLPDVLNIAPPSTGNMRHIGSLPVIIQLPSNVVPSLNSGMLDAMKDDSSHSSNCTSVGPVLSCDATSLPEADQTSARVKLSDIQHNVQHTNLSNRPMVISVVRPNGSGGKGMQQIIDHFIEKNSLWKVKDIHTHADVAQQLECSLLALDASCSSLISLDGDGKYLPGPQCVYDSELQDALLPHQTDDAELSAEGVHGSMMKHNESTALDVRRNEKLDNHLSPERGKGCTDLAADMESQLIGGTLITSTATSATPGKEFICTEKGLCSRYDDCSSDEVDGSITLESNQSEEAEVADLPEAEQIPQGQQDDLRSSGEPSACQTGIQTTKKQNVCKPSVGVNHNTPTVLTQLLLDTARDKEKENGCSVIISIVPGNGTAAAVAVHRVVSDDSSSDINAKTRCAAETARSSEPRMGDGKSKLIRCDFCTATFTRQGNLTRHKKIHTVDLQEEKCYQCLYCKRPFLQRCDMNRHMQIHTKQEPFRCSTCGKGYIRKSDLVVHERFHSKNRVFKCDKCERCFCQSGDLKRHIRLVHAEKSSLTCDHCHRKYAKETTLIHHMKVAHSNILLQSAANLSKVSR